MAITLKGIRIESVSASREKDGGYKIESSYALISSMDKVLAKQDVGGYNGLKIEPAAATVKAFEDFVALYKTDLTSVLGLEAE